MAGYHVSGTSFLAGVDLLMGARLSPSSRTPVSDCKKHRHCVHETLHYCF